MNLTNKKLKWLEVWWTESVDQSETYLVSVPDTWTDDDCENIISDHEWELRELIDEIDGNLDCIEGVTIEDAEPGTDGLAAEFDRDEDGDFVIRRPGDDDAPDSQDSV